MRTICSSTHQRPESWGLTSGGKKNWHSITRHQRKLGADFKLPLPGCPHRGGPELKCEQLGGAEKKKYPAKTSLLESAQEEQHHTETAVVLLQVHHRVHTNYCLCVWFTSCTTAQRKEFQRVNNTTQKIVGSPSPFAGRPARCSLRQKSTEHWEGHFLPRTPIVQTVSFGGTIQDHQIKNKET